MSFRLVVRHAASRPFPVRKTCSAGSLCAQDRGPPPAALAAIALDITTRTVDGFPVYEIAPKAGESRQRLLYLHGGAFVFEITSYHWGLIAEMAERVGFGITVPIYPIAPEHDFHAMFGMVRQVYRQMLGETDAETSSSSAIPPAATWPWC